MNRPLFLQRLSNRIARNVTGADRGPVHPDFRNAYLLLGTGIALFGVCFASLVLIGIFGSKFINLICMGQT